MTIKLARIKVYRFRFLPVVSAFNEHPGLVSTAEEVSLMLDEAANFAASDTLSGRPGQRDLCLQPQETTANTAAPTANFKESLHTATYDCGKTTSRVHVDRIGCAGFCVGIVERPARNW